MNKNLSRIQSFAKAKAEYIDFYQRTLPEPRYVNNILEIGFNLASLKALSEIYPNSLVHSLDFFGPSISMTPEEIESLGFFVYNMNGKSGKPRSFNEISSKFDIIIDTGTHPLLRQMIFSHLFNDNLIPNGMFYMEDLNSEKGLSINAKTGNTESPSITGEDCKSLARAIFDADRLFSNKFLSVSTINKIIDLSQWSDMSKQEDIAGFKKIKVQEKKINQDPGVLPQKPVQIKKALPPAFVLPETLNIKFFGENVVTMPVPEKYGPLKKDILISFFGRIHELPEVFGIYNSNPDFYFADLDWKSERYRLEMSRSLFSLCTNDRAILCALIHDTIPIIISNDDIHPDFYDHLNYPAMLICHADELQSRIGLIYTNFAQVNTMVANGKLLLRKIATS